VKNRALGTKWGERVTWHRVRQRRFGNPGAEVQEFFQGELLGERRMLKECETSLVCLKCTWAIV